MRQPKWECQICGAISENCLQPEFCSECETYGEMWSVFRIVTDAEPLNTPVGELARDDVLTIDGDETIFAAPKPMRTKGARSLTVMVHGQPVGLLTERDILHRAVAESLPITSVTIRKKCLRR